MDWFKPLLDAVGAPGNQDLLYSGLHTGLEFIGAGALIVALLPRLVAKGKPLSVKTADRLCAIALAIPVVRDIVIWQAPAIIKFLHDLFDALEAIMEAFENRVAQRIEEAAKPAEEAAKPTEEEPKKEAPPAK